MFRIYIPEMDIDIQNEDKDFLENIIDSIKNNRYELQALEWVKKGPVIESGPSEKWQAYGVMP